MVSSFSFHQSLLLVLLSNSVPVLLSYSVLSLPVEYNIYGYKSGQSFLSDDNYHGNNCAVV